jgi:hypothetical protein
MDGGHAARDAPMDTHVRPRLDELHLGVMKTPDLVRFLALRHVGSHEAFEAWEA